MFSISGKCEFVMTDYTYDVVMSFAGEDREYVERFVRLLQKQKVRVFYDRDNQHEIWGKDLTEYLPPIYRDNAIFGIVFVSKYYKEKLWTQYELNQMRARDFKERGGYILPIVLDDTSLREIPGINDTRGYLDARTESMDYIVLSLVRKIREFYLSTQRKQNLSCDVDDLEYDEEKYDSREKIYIKNPDGTIEVANIVLIFELKANGKEYCVYTKEEQNVFDETTIYTAQVHRGPNGTLSLSGIEDETEWQMIKAVLEELSEATEDEGPTYSGLKEPDGIEYI